MTPTPAPLEARTQTANRVRIFMFLRPRRILAALSIFMIAALGTASALPGVPAVPGVPGVPGVPALPEAPELPAVDQDLQTPVGGASAHLADGYASVCANAAADTSMLPQAPALPAAPVPTPALPALPDTSAGAAADLCADVDTNELSANAKAGASAYGAGQKADLDAETSGTEGKVEAQTGFFETIVQWFMALF